MNRVPVSYSGTAGPFEKWLMPEPDQDQDGDVDLADFTAFIANPILNLNEHLVVGPGSPWTDWHEVILTPDWIWGQVQLTTPTTPPGPTNLSVVQQGANVSFFFDPIAPGTPVDIRKQLAFNGTITGAMINDFLQGQFMIRVAEHPTVPEPTALVCGGVALVVAIAFRQQRRCRPAASVSL